MNHYYQDEAVTIYHGDCREVIRELGANLVADLLFTDPPYGIGFAAQPTDYQRARGFEPRAWDDAPVDAAFLNALVARCGAAVVWGGIYYPLPVSRGWLVWLKPDAPPSMSQLDFAWTSFDQNARIITHSIAATNGERCGHPTQKPLRVTRWALDQVPLDFRVVLDPFAGSGTTLRAVKDLQRKAIGIEIDEGYCEIAARRCAQEVLSLSNPEGT